MKRLISFFIILICPKLIFAQPDITVGKPYRVVDAYSKYYFSRGSNVLTLKIQKRDYIIQKLDGNGLNFIQEKFYNDMPDDIVIEKITEFNDRYFVFYSLWDKPNKTEQLFYREIDFEKGTFKDQHVCLLKVQGKITGVPLGSVGYWNYGVSDKFDFQFSYDRSKILIQYRLKPEIKNDDKNYDIIGMHVLDKDLKTVWQKEVKMPYTESMMNNIDYSVDSDGNAYILTTVADETDDPKPKKKHSNYHIELLKIQGSAKEIQITPVTLEGKFINSIWLYESPKKTMICAGFYSNIRGNSSVNGILIFQVGKDGFVASKNSFEIPLELLNQNASRKEQKKNEKKDAKDAAEFENLELRKLEILEDGSIILAGEQYYTYTVTYTDANGRTSTRTYYCYNDMLLAKVNPDGKLAWMKKLPKRQVGGAGRGGMSYKFISNKNGIYLVYLDHEKNINLSPDEVPVKHQDGAGGFLTAYKVGYNGDVSKISIANMRKVNGFELFQFSTGRILPISEDEFIFEAYKKKKEDVLIKVKLK
ncbi:MAG: hypothetical protein ACK40G_06770 [Cytophagaceae bacterium]